MDSGFRKLRRIDKQIDSDTVMKMLSLAPYSVVAFPEGEEGFPYALPVNVAYFDGALWYHGFKEGLKHDCLAKNNKVCVTTVLDATIRPDELSTEFTSVIIYGKAHKVEPEQYMDAIVKFGMFFADKFPDDIKRSAESYKNATVMVRIDIEHITAKRSREG